MIQSLHEQDCPAPERSNLQQEYNHPRLRLA